LLKSETEASPLRAGLRVVASDTPEHVELAARRDLVEQLATATGGRVLGDFEIEQLPSLLRSRTLQTVRIEETTLWDKPGALVAFFVLLTLEWVLRKRIGLY
jgi:hypothetical protein